MRFHPEHGTDRQGIQGTHGMDLMTVNPNLMLSCLHGERIGPHRPPLLREHHQLTVSQHINRVFQVADVSCHFFPGKDSPASHK